MSNINCLNFSLYQMQLFLTVCKCKSFTVASQILCATQSSVSKSIASMEKALEFPLFIRSKNQLELTRAGDSLFNEWQHIIRNIEISVDKAFLIYKREQYSLIVGEPDSMKTYKDYHPAIKKFQDENKDYNMLFVQMPIGELIPKLIANELDVIFTIDYDVPSLDSLGIKWKIVAESPLLYIAMHESNPLLKKKSISMTDFKNEEFIVMTPSLHQNYIDLLIKVFEPYGFKPKIRVSSPNARSMMSTLINTQSGAVLANRFLYDFDSPHIKLFPIENTYSCLIVVWRDKGEHSKIEEFVEKVAANFPKK